MLTPLCAAIALIARPIEDPSAWVWTSGPLEKGPRTGCVAALRGATQASSGSLAWLCPKPGGPTVEELGATPGLEKTPLSWTARGTDEGAEFWFGVEGGVLQAVWRPGESLSSSMLLDDPTLAPAALPTTLDLDLDGSQDLLQVAFDGLRGYARRADRLELLWTAPLPARLRSGASIVVDGLLPDDPPQRTRYTRLEPTHDGRFRASRLALGPTAPTRCEIVIRPTEPVSAWESIPIPGDPDRLASVARTATRFQLFGEWLLMIAPARCDDTGRGVPSSAILETPLADWHPASLIAQPASASRPAELWMSGATGRFKPQPAIAVYGDDGRTVGPQSGLWEGGKESEGGRIRAWKDVTGDRLPDLLVSTASQLLIYRGLPGPRSHWERSPFATIELPEGGRVGLVEALELDDDEQVELLISISRNDNGQGRQLSGLHWIDLPAGPPQR